MNKLNQQLRLPIFLLENTKRIAYKIILQYLYKTGILSTDLDGSKKKKKSLTWVPSTGEIIPKHFFNTSSKNPNDGRTPGPEAP